MSAELFKALTGTDMVHVPYRGTALAYPDLITNKVQVLFDNLPAALEQMRAGTMRGLGVTSPQRWPGLPDIPAISESVPGFDVVAFYGISAPKGTPPEIVDVLNRAVAATLKDPKLVASRRELSIRARFSADRLSGAISGLDAKGTAAAGGTVAAGCAEAGVSAPTLSKSN